MPVSRDAVKYAYKLFLGRDISALDNTEKLYDHFCKVKDEDTLAETFIRCDEFRIRNKSSKYIKFLGPNEHRERSSERFDPNAILKISFFGNCQLQGIGKIIESLYSEAHSISFHLGAGNNHERLLSGEFTKIINDSDLIVTQSHALLDTIASKYPESRSRIRIVPNTPFSGFHPDNDYIQNKSGERIAGGPLEAAHSVLTAWCWNHGMTTLATQEVFHEDVFDHLGYYSSMAISKKNLLKIGYSCDYPICNMLTEWLSRGCFMHTINHPKLFVLGDIANEFLRKEGVPHNPETYLYLHDDLADSVCWPVYPEIANRFNLSGSYNFKKSGVPWSYPKIIGLKDFILASFDNYNKLEKGSLQSPRFQEEGFQTLDLLINKRKNIKKGISQRSPYAGLPSHCFWKRAVATIEPKFVDPVVVTRFQVSKAELVATAGSCFAQHIAKRLSAEGFNYYVPEDGGSLSEEVRRERNYGVFSCRYGNLYTTRQLVQLFDRSMGRFTPLENAWKRPDGRYVDPFRPQIEPDGFESEEAMLQSRTEHLACVREMFTKLDILVFTLGLTESWESREDGAVFPLAPGVSGGAMDPSRHRFRNLTAKEVADDLELFLLKLQGVNPKARVILTVSPVPLIATYENRHVLVSNTHSKSVLRTVAGEMASRYSQCEYFPSYEIITGQHVGNGYLEEDLRSVRSEGVDHVMGVFLKHYAGKTGSITIETTQREREQQSAIERINDIICDEEAIERNT